MRQRHQANVELIFAVAERLGPLLDRVVFCGGAVTGLLITDTAAADVSSTKDVDAIVAAVAYNDYAEAQAQLRQLGFSHDLREGAPACRFIVDGIMVDLMPTDGSNFGWSTTFYPTAVASAQVHELRRGDRTLNVLVISAPLFVATKLEAFGDRGHGDYGGSKDIADVMSVVDGRAELIDELAIADPAARDFVRAYFRKLLDDSSFLNQVDYLNADGDGSAILARLEIMAAG